MTTELVEIVDSQWTRTGNGIEVHSWRRVRGVSVEGRWHVWILAVEVDDGSCEVSVGSSTLILDWSKVTMLSDGPKSSRGGRCRVDQTKQEGLRGRRTGDID